MSAPVRPSARCRRRRHPSTAASSCTPPSGRVPPRPRRPPRRRDTADFTSPLPQFRTRSAVTAERTRSRHRRPLLRRKIITHRFPARSLPTTANSLPDPEPERAQAARSPAPCRPPRSPRSTPGGCAPNARRARGPVGAARHSSGRHAPAVPSPRAALRFLRRRPNALRVGGLLAAPPPRRGAAAVRPPCAPARTAPSAPTNGCPADCRARTAPTRRPAVGPVSPPGSFTTPPPLAVVTAAPCPSADRPRAEEFLRHPATAAQAV